MKREDLQKLFLAEGQTELSDDQKKIVDQIMAMNGKDIEAAKGDSDKLKSDLEAAQADAEAKQKQIEAANAKIKEFEGKDLDLEAIRKSAADWEAQAKQAQTDADAKLAQVKFDHALERALVAGKALDAKTVRPLLNLDGLKYDDKSDQVIGLEDQLKGIREEKAFLFQPEQTEEEKPPPPTATAGGTPPRKTDPLSFLERTMKAAGLEPAEKGKTT
jgi:hypothetical protein